MSYLIIVEFFDRLLILQFKVVYLEFLENLIAFLKLSKPLGEDCEILSYLFLCLRFNIV